MSFPARRLPQELLNHLIDQVQETRFENRDSYTVTLQSCALACKALRDRSQEYLFSTVEIRSSAQCTRLRDVFLFSPGLARHVNELEVDVKEVLGDADVALAQIIGAYKWVEWMELMGYDEIYPGLVRCFEDIKFSKLNKLSLEYCGLPLFDDLFRFASCVHNRGFLALLGVHIIEFLEERQPGPWQPSSLIFRELSWKGCQMSPIGIDLFAGSIRKQESMEIVIETEEDLTLLRHVTSSSVGIADLTLSFNWYQPDTPEG
jgi:hypothetical protein